MLPLDLILLHRPQELIALSLCLSRPLGAKQRLEGTLLRTSPQIGKHVGLDQDRGCDRSARDVRELAVLLTVLLQEATVVALHILEPSQSKRPGALEMRNLLVVKADVGREAIDDVARRHGSLSEPSSSTNRAAMDYAAELPLDAMCVVDHTEFFTSFQCLCVTVCV